MPRRVAAAALLAPMLAGTLIGAAPTADLDVDLAQLRSAKGMVRLCLTADPDNFPRCTDDRNALTRSLPASVRQVRFASLSPGSYAVAVVHDENGNRKLDTLAGIPREGFGFSRNPPIRFGAPRFAAARFTLDGGAQVQQVRMRYIF